MGRAADGGCRVGQPARRRPRRVLGPTAGWRRDPRRTARGVLPRCWSSWCRTESGCPSSRTTPGPLRSRLLASLHAARTAVAGLGTLRHLGVGTRRVTLRFLAGAPGGASSRPSDDAMPKLRRAGPARSMRGAGRRLLGFRDVHRRTGGAFVSVGLATGRGAEWRGRGRVRGVVGPVWRAGPWRGVGAGPARRPGSRCLDRRLLVVGSGSFEAPGAGAAGGGAAQRFGRFGCGAQGGQAQSAAMAGHRQP